MVVILINDCAFSPGRRHTIALPPLPLCPVYRPCPMVAPPQSELSTDRGDKYEDVVLPPALPPLDDGSIV